MDACRLGHNVAQITNRNATNPKTSGRGIDYYNQLSLNLPNGDSRSTKQCYNEWRMGSFTWSSIDTSEQSVISAFTNLSQTSRHTESTRSASSGRRRSQETCDTNRFWLSLEKLGIVGRDDEVRQLHDALAAVVKTGNSTFVVCRGPSGVGKSKLLESLRNPMFQQEGFFVSGKFDQLLNQQASFSAISSTFSDLCDLLLQHEEKRTLVKALKARLGRSDIRALSRGRTPWFGYVFALCQTV